MPREIKMFGCDFKCGRVASKLSRMIIHEAMCYHNPKRRACQTCRHYVPAYGEADVNYFEEASCKVREDVDFTKSLEHDCPKWESGSNVKAADTLGESRNSPHPVSPAPPKEGA